MSLAAMVNDFGGLNRAHTFAPRRLYRLGAILLLLLLTVVASRAQVNSNAQTDNKNVEVLEGAIDGNAYGIGKSIQINGAVKDGAIAFGGDVIIQGTVNGDVAAIGGSVIQLEGGRIGGDVIVIGGTYRHADKNPNRTPAKRTLLYAGYEQELRDMMRNPTGLLSPAWSPTYIGLRLLAVLFWFVIAMVLTAAIPGAVSRGVARLQMTSLRVAAIGFLGAIVVGMGVEACLFLLPTPFSTLVGLMTLMLIVLAGVFGRVVIYAATGRWLQRRFLSRGHHSESIALLLGALVWSVLSSLPYIWPFILAFTLVLSLGLALTAGRRNTWKKVPAI
ncbi:MAG: hypothetical protein JWM21_2875 [Acidobacteria bacterium]|nr:hypothetical protein [Acidobacteriota bacterium]